MHIDLVHRHRTAKLPRLEALVLELETSQREPSGPHGCTGTGPLEAQDTLT